MAASGIAEHHEARRKQCVINKQAHRLKMMIDNMRDQPDMFEPRDDRPPTSYEQELSSGSYMRKMGSPPGIGNHHAPIMDKLRRDQVRQQQMLDYSAKLPNRLSSTDYTQQW